MSSISSNNNNKHFFNLAEISTKNRIMTVICLKTNCNIVMLDKGDYIVIDDIKYEFNYAYTYMNFEAFID